MELKDFISKSLQDICEGIKESRENIELLLGGNQVIAPGRIEGKAQLSQSSIDFDIAVTHSQTDIKSKGGNLKISVVAGELSNKSNLRNETISRLRFSVPYLPQGIKPNKKS